MYSHTRHHGCCTQHKLIGWVFSCSCTSISLTDSSSSSQIHLLTYGILDWGYWLSQLHSRKCRFVDQRTVICYCSGFAKSPGETHRYKTYINILSLNLLFIHFGFVFLLYYCRCLICIQHLPSWWVIIVKRTQIPELYQLTIVNVISSTLAMRNCKRSQIFNWTHWIHISEVLTN